MAYNLDIKLLNLFIFNPTFSETEEEEEKKIIYYYPNKTDKDTQLKTAGLCEALVKFTTSFNSEDGCEAVHTEKTRQLYYQPEENYWMVMTLGVPSPQEDEYRDSQVQDNVFQSVLVQCYQMFRLFNGTFTSVIDSIQVEDSLGDLREKTFNFFSHYLSTLKLRHCDILDVFQGISFLPLGKDPFLHVNSFISLIETSFNCVKYSVFLYNDQLVWSGISPADMQILYQYLINILLPSHLDLELQGGSLPKTHNTTVHHYGSFVTGPAELQDSLISTKKVPKVYLHNDSTPETFHLVVYRALSATLCLFIEKDNALNLNLFRELDAFLGPKLTKLVSEVAEHCVKQSVAVNHENGPKFVYYNKLNLAQKSTVHVDTRKNGNISVSPEIVRLMADVNACKSKSSSSEIMMKTGDNWLVCKYSNGREFYVVVSQKKATLIDVSEEVKKLSDTQLKGIFFLE